MNLVAILLDDVETARKARAELAAMENEHLVSLEDAVVVYKTRSAMFSLTRRST